MKGTSPTIFSIICLLAILLSPTAFIHADSSEEGGLSIIQRPETIRITEEGRIYVGERETRLNRLARNLRREGYAPEDTIYVSIPERTPRRVLVDVGRELASRGYRRVIFTRPPRAISEAEGESNE